MSLETPSPDPQPRVRRGAPESWDARVLRRLAMGSRAGQARGVLRIWQLWERLALRLWPPAPVPGSPHGIFMVRVETYHGRPIVLPDGTSVDRGDVVGELHVDNRALLATVGERKWDAAPRMREDLRAIAQAVEDGVFGSDLRAFYGMTLLSRAAGRVGFTVRSRHPTPLAWFDRIYMQGLLLLYAPEGSERVARGTSKGFYPGEVWLSRGELLRRYGSGQQS